MVLEKILLVSLISLGKKILPSDSHIDLYLVLYLSYVDLCLCTTSTFDSSISTLESSTITDNHIPEKVL